MNKVNYLEDNDLEFFSKLKNSDLDILVEVLIKDVKDGKSRWTETLTQNEVYKKYSPDHHKYWKEIAREIQCFGANTIATVFRGGSGVLYREILFDVCDKFKVTFNKDESVEEIEGKLLLKIFIDSIEKMENEDLKKLVEDLNIDTNNLTQQAVALAVQTTISTSGFLAYKVAVIVANSLAKALIGRGLSFAANAALTRALSIAIPLGWLILGIWTTISITSPATRVTHPAVILVASLRAKSKYEEQTT